MNKKINFFFIIGWLCILEKSVICMNEDASVKHTLQALQYLVKKGFLSSFEINDYIIPVKTFSQALKKERHFSYAHLIRMQRMNIEIFNKYNQDHHLQKGIGINEIVMRKTYSKIIRKFCSSVIKISYYKDHNLHFNAELEITPHIVYLFSGDSVRYVYKSLPSKSIVTPVNTRLETKLKKILKNGDACWIEVKSSGDLSDWIKVAHY